MHDLEYHTQTIELIDSIIKDGSNIDTKNILKVLKRLSTQNYYTTFILHKMAKALGIDSTLPI